MKTATAILILATFAPAAEAQTVYYQQSNIPGLYQVLVPYVAPIYPNPPLGRYGPGNVRQPRKRANIHWGR